jgi:hypothetical protein
MQIVTLLRMKPIGKVRVGKHLYYTFPIQSGLKLGDALWPLLLNFALD